MGFAESNAGIQADSLSIDAGGKQGIATLAQIVADLGDDISIRRVVLHRLRRSLHVHQDHSSA